MAQDTICLKRTCIAFSVIYAILGGIVLVIGILASSLDDDVKHLDDNSSITVFCVMGSLVILLALLGLFGACKEKRWALRLYTAFLVVHAIGCFRGLTNLSSLSTENTKDEFRQLIPLSQADPGLQKAIDKLQTVAECCGLLSYEDWGYSIPQSCHCPPAYEDRESKCHRVPGYTSVNWDSLSGTDAAAPEVEVYKEPCGPILLTYMQMGMKFVAGLVVTFVVVLVISIILHLALTYQIKQQAPVIPMTISQDLKPPPYTAPLGNLRA